MSEALTRHSVGERILAHLSIARLDHIAKNVFILPGVALALLVERGLYDRPGFFSNLVIGFIALTLVACSNYVINEVLDAPFDRFHPTKKSRPVPSGRVFIPLAYLQWVLMMVAGLALAAQLNRYFVYTLMVLWIMGCIYNIPPIRSKDLPYLDVLSESINNPLRLLAGWYMVLDHSIPPASLLIAYWMVGAYFMGLKRFSEYREIGDLQRASAYRKSFGHYTEERLMVSISFYSTTAMLFFGAFIVRYKLELVLSFPLVALVMAIYLQLAFAPDSAVQNPEKLHQQPRLMAAVITCAVLMAILMVVRLQWLHDFFQPSIPNL